MSKLLEQNPENFEQVSKINTKVKEIKSKQGPSFNMAQDKKIQSSFNIKKQKTEKKLDEENAKILNNILEISRRKTHFWMNDNDKYWSFPVSLNINTRKNKSEEIYKENKKIADSLSKCKGSSDYSAHKLLVEAERAERLKGMITKKRKLQAIKRQMDTVSKGANPSGRFLKFQDVVNDALAKLKNLDSATLAAEAPLDRNKIIHWLKTTVAVDKKITDFLLELQERGGLLEGEPSAQDATLLLEKTQQALELVNMQQINNLKIENSVERMPFVKAVQILFSIEDKDVEKVWEMLAEKSTDSKTVDFRDMCVWIVSRNE